MNKIKQISTIGLCCAIICGSLFITSYADTSEIKVTIDGKAVTFTDAKPRIVEGRTLVPIRFISEEIGDKVNWDQATKTVTITDELNKLTMVINQKETVFNGLKMNMDVAPIIENGRTMIPLRFAMERLGLIAEWDNNNNTVNLLTSERTKLYFGTNAAPIEKQVEKLVENNIFMAAMYGADKEQTKLFLLGLDRINNELDNSSDVSDTVCYEAVDEGKCGVELNSKKWGHDIAIIQYDRSEPSFQATMAALDYLFDRMEGGKIWVNILDSLNREELGDTTEYKDEINGYAYSIQVFSPDGIKILIDKD